MELADLVYARATVTQAFVSRGSSEGCATSCRFCGLQDGAQECPCFAKQSLRGAVGLSWARICPGMQESAGTGIGRTGSARRCSGDWRWKGRSSAAWPGPLLLPTNCGPSKYHSSCITAALAQDLPSTEAEQTC